MVWSHSRRARCGALRLRHEEPPNLSKEHNDHTLQFISQNKVNFIDSTGRKKQEGTCLCVGPTHVDLLTDQSLSHRAVLVSL